MFVFFVCLVSCTGAYASEGDNQMLLVLDLDSSLPDYDPIPYYPTQTCYAYITIKHTDSAGLNTETVVSVPVAMIEYKYEVYYDDGVYTGGRIGGEPYPKVTATSSSTYPSGSSVRKLTSPTLRDFNTGSSYSFVISGGSFSITYNSVLHYHEGELVPEDTETTTELRAFYLPITGP